MTLKTYESSLIERLEGLGSTDMGVLGDSEPGDRWRKTIMYRSDEDIRDTTPLQACIQDLREQGLDIGKGDAAFGYRMPLPGKDDRTRILEVFRRH